MNETIFAGSAHAYPADRAAPNMMAVWIFMAGSIPYSLRRVTHAYRLCMV